MRASKIFLAVATLAVPALLACSDEDPTNVPLEGLTDAEVQEFFVALQTAYQYSPSTPSVGGPSLAPFFAPETFVTDTTTTTTQPCPLAGSVVSVVDNETTTISDVRFNPSPDTTYAVDATFTGDIDVNTTYSNCQAQDSQGRTWTISADPGLAWDINLDGEIHLAALNGGVPVNYTDFQWDGQWQGSLNWEHDGRSGTCAVSLTMAGSTTSNGGQTNTSSSASGQMCGVAVSFSN